MFPKSASSILVVFCMVAVVFTGCLDDAEEVEEALPEEVKCLLITGEYQIVDLETTASAGMSSGDETNNVVKGHIKFSNSYYQQDVEKCIFGYYIVDADSNLHVNSDNSVYEYMAEISGNSSNMVIIDTDGSVILDDDIEEYSGSLDDSGNITLSGVAVLVPCDGCFDDAKKGELIVGIDGNAPGEDAGCVDYEDENGNGLYDSGEPCNDDNVTEEPEENVTQDYNMTVTEVVDGDTFYLGNGDKVRMIGINTPESGRPYAQEATDFLTNMILGKEVTLVNDSNNPESDSYGRLLAHVYMNGTSVNYEIIKAGFAFWYPYTSGTDFDTEYEEAQVFASNNTVGLWTESSYNFTIDHIEYNPEGSEADGEYVVLTNHENYNVSMIGWFLQDEAAQTAYEFNFTIANNTSIRIYTGEGIDNSTTLYWGWYQGIWNNSGDFAIIQDENGYMVANYRY